MGLGRVGAKVGPRFRLRSTEEAQGVQQRDPAGGLARQESHRGDDVHSVRRNAALLVAIAAVWGSALPDV